MPGFSDLDRINLVYALKLEPSQSESYSVLSFLMTELENGDARFSRNYVQKVQDWLTQWLALDNELDAENPIIKEQEAAAAIQGIDMQRIEGQFEVQYNNAQRPLGYVSSLERKKQHISRILALLDPYKRLHRYTIKSQSINT